MGTVRLTNKEGRTKHISEHVLDSKGAEWWKAQGWAIDPKPYNRIVTAKGVVYTLDKDAWEAQQKMHEMAEPKEEPKEEPKKRTPRKHKA